MNTCCYYSHLCDSCDFCNYCNYCDSCDFCNYCYYCYACDYSKNLRMTEFNLFCYSKDSVRQNPYRVFNKEVGETRYKELLSLISDVRKNDKKVSLQDFWKSLTTAQIQKIAEIPEFDKEVFEFITNIKVENDLKGKIVSITIDGKTYSAQIL